ncbi:MAG: metallophosphoesterase [Gammaproteobacteria bacterium]|nr:metallophosphoesterase [Gammaproteobacteria bacterium]
MPNNPIPSDLHDEKLFSVFFSSSCYPFGALAEDKQLVVIHTNDFHGHIKAEGDYAGAARIAALVAETRATHERVLVLDAGDAISGTPVSTMFEGLPIFEILNMVGYDAGAIGNHEFATTAMPASTNSAKLPIIRCYRPTRSHPTVTSSAMRLRSSRRSAAFAWRSSASSPTTRPT